MGMIATGGDFNKALESGWNAGVRGAAMGGAIGLGAGAFTGYKYAKANNIDPWTGKSLAPKNTIESLGLSKTMDRIKNGESLPYRNDGSIFQNREGLLPNKPDGYYIEYVHPTPGINGPGPQRIIIGLDGEIYYTPNHYKTFIPVEQ
jgi:filamentous hemagglutinin